MQSDDHDKSRVSPMDEFYIDQKWLQLVRDDGTFRGGSLQRIVRYVVFLNDDVVKTRCVLYGFRHFYTPKEVLEALSETYQEKVAISLVSPASLSKVVNNFLWEWINLFLPIDFNSTSMRKLLFDLTSTTMSIDDQNKLKLLCLAEFGKPKKVSSPAKKKIPAVRSANFASDSNLQEAVFKSTSRSLRSFSGTDLLKNSSDEIKLSPRSSGDKSEPSSRRTSMHTSSSFVNPSHSLSSSRSLSPPNMPSSSSYISQSVPSPPINRHSSMSSSISGGSAIESPLRPSSPSLKISKSSPGTQFSPILPSNSLTFISDALSAKTSLLMSHKIDDLASQLTLLESQMFTRVQPFEFHNNIWQKNDKLNKAPNIVTLLEQANKIAFWIAMEIVQAGIHQDIKFQARVLERAIKLAQKLREMNNYNTLKEVEAGINHSSVTRLKKLWTHLDSGISQIFQDLQTLMDPISNFSNYRAHLRKLVATEPLVPILPYLGTFLRDVTFANDANPDFLDLGGGQTVLNFDKLHLVGMQIIFFNIFKKSPYQIQGISSIQAKLLVIPCFSEDQIREYSEVCEPPRKNP